MKKRTRNITVNNKSYIWLADEVLFPEGLLKIWLKGNKKKTLIEMLFSIEEKIITPATVEGIVKLVHDTDTDYEKIDSTILLMWDEKSEKAILRDCIDNKRDT